jgi:hypothetical protein
MHFCCSSVYCCFALLLLIDILLLCTFVIHWHLLDVHSLCLSTPPCCTPPYSSMLQIHILLWPPSALHHLLICAHVACWHLLTMGSWYVLFLLIGTSLLCTLDVYCCCSLAPPCRALKMLIGISLLCALDVCSYCSLAPRCCVLMFFIGTSLLCALDVFLCMCGRKQFSTFFSISKFFVFLIFFYRFFLWSVLFFHFVHFVVVSHFLLSWFAFKYVFSNYFLVYVFILMKHVSKK